MPSIRAIPPTVRTLLKGLAMGESPRWHEGRLWVADWGAQEIIAVDPDGKSEVVLQGSFGLPFCIDWLPDGHLVIVSAKEKRVLRKQANGTLVPYADLTSVSDKSWNEIVVDGRGNAYINGAGFEITAGETFATGLIALISADGSVQKVADGIAFPNGMAVTPDNSTLVVAESYGKKLTAFDIAVDGSLSNRHVWAPLNGYPDGICLDAEGAVWYADVPNKRCVRVREGGEVLQTVDLELGCFACALGGQDKKTLFMIATEWRGMEKMLEVAQARIGQVLAIEVSAPKAGWP